MGGARVEGTGVEGGGGRVQSRKGVSGLAALLNLGEIGRWPPVGGAGKNLNSKCLKIVAEVGNTSRSYLLDSRLLPAMYFRPQDHSVELVFGARAQSARLQNAKSSGRDERTELSFTSVGGRWRRRKRIRNRTGYESLGCDFPVRAACRAAEGAHPMCLNEAPDETLDA